METVKQEIEATETVERTFTQAEVDAIVGDRLKRDRAKYADYETLKEKAEKYDAVEEANKSELQKLTESRDALQTEVERLKAESEVRDIRLKVAEETGVPVSLITATTEDDCKAQAASILEFASPKGYPSVRDAGELTNKGKSTTKQQFAEWAEQAFKR